MHSLFPGHPEPTTAFKVVALAIAVGAIVLFIILQP